MSKLNREGNAFALQWICEIFDINIDIWGVQWNRIAQRFQLTYAYLNTIYLKHFATGNAHMHFWPLLKNEEICGIPCTIPKSIYKCNQIKDNVNTINNVLHVKHNRVDNGDGMEHLEKERTMSNQKKTK